MFFNSVKNLSVTLIALVSPEFISLDMSFLSFSCSTEDAFSNLSSDVCVASAAATSDSLKSLLYSAISWFVSNI